jgi:hypothetical protein
MDEQRACQGRTPLHTDRGSTVISDAALSQREISNVVLKNLARVLIWTIRVPAFAYALILLVGTGCLVVVVNLGREAFARLVSNRSLKLVAKLWPRIRIFLFLR